MVLSSPDEQAEIFGPGLPQHENLQRLRSVFGRLR